MEQGLPMLQTQEQAQDMILSRPRRGVRSRLRKGRQEQAEKAAGEEDVDVEVLSSQIEAPVSPSK
jgi:hypothetical protein